MVAVEVPVAVGVHRKLRADSARLHGVLKDKYPGSECGGIYPRWLNNHEAEGHSPRVNASLPPGQWQTFDVVFRAPRFDTAGKKIRNGKFVKVVHNGKVIHEIGLPWHWGWQGRARGDVVNNLSALVADPNVSIHEGKVFTCNIRAGKRGGAA